MKGQPASHGQTKTHRKMGATGGGGVIISFEAPFKTNVIGWSAGGVIRVCRANKLA